VVAEVGTRKEYRAPLWQASSRKRVLIVGPCEFSQIRSSVSVACASAAGKRGTSVVAGAPALEAGPGSGPAQSWRGAV